MMIFLVCFQMEDGHTMFDYSVGLNDIVQLLIRQPAVDLKNKDKSKDKEAELSDSDSGCGSAQSESDKSSTHGEAEGQAAGTSAQVEAPELIDPGFGLYKVRGFIMFDWEDIACDLTILRCITIDSHKELFIILCMNSWCCNFT